MPLPTINFEGGLSMPTIGNHLSVPKASPAVYRMDRDSDKDLEDFEDAELAGGDDDAVNTSDAIDHTREAPGHATPEDAD